MDFSVSCFQSLFLHKILKLDAWVLDVNLRWFHLTFYLLRTWLSLKDLWFFNNENLLSCIIQPMFLKTQMALVSWSHTFPGIFLSGTSDHLLVSLLVWSVPTCNMNNLACGQQENLLERFPSKVHRLHVFQGVWRLGGLFHNTWCSFQALTTF